MRPRLIALLAPLWLAACVTVPPGPSVQVLPGSQKSFQQFQADDASCRQFALSRSGAPNDAANEAGVASAVAGTALGALIGAAIGGGEGAAVGAGLGLFTGAAAGSANAQATFAGAQRQYDSAYLQCMYARGNRVPMAMAGSAAAPRGAVRSGFAAPANATAPPPGTPPPNAAIPPPGALPPNAAIPPPGTPPPSQLPTYQLPR